MNQMESILQSNPRLLRAILFLACFTLLLYFIVTRIFHSVSSVSDISVEVNEKGGLIFKAARKGNQERYAQFLLPSNKIWMNTGIDIEEDEECEFQVTGNVHLAINSLVRSVDNDQIPAIKWTGAAGSPWEKVGDEASCAAAKKQLCILPGDHVGNVVGYFYKKGEISDADFLKYFLTSRKDITKDIFNIGERIKQPNNTKERVRLFICVNDILLDMSDSAQTKLSQVAFEGRPGGDNASKWLILLKEKSEYVRIWFDDNVGGFLVNVTIRKKQHG